MLYQMTYLLCRNAKTGQWTPEFADPSASVVRQEKRDSYDRQQRKELGFDKVVVCTTYAASAAEALLEAGKIAIYATDKDLRRRESKRAIANLRLDTERLLSEGERLLSKDGGES